MDRKNAYIPIFISLAVFIVFAGYIYIRNQSITVRREKQKELTAIAGLKIAGISDWYDDEVHDAKVISKNYFLIEKIETWLRGKNAAATKQLQYSIASFKDEHGYENIILSTPEGRVIMDAEDPVPPTDSTLSNFILKCVNAEAVISTDLYKSPEREKVYIDFISPVIGTNNKVIAALVFRHNPDDFLFPLIQSWPYPSKTSESLLVRGENDSIVFLNQLRHRPDPALSIKMPMSMEELPAVNAALGNTGIFNGVDYRGVKVISYTGPVPHTPWSMAVKVDKSEMFAGLKKVIIFSLIMLILIILLLASGFILFASTRQKNIYKTLLKTQEEYKTTLYSIGDGVITTNEEGLLLHLNPVAEKLTGWKEKESKGKTSEKVLCLINENTQEKIDNPVQQILREEQFAGPTNHILLRTKSGEEIPVSISGAPIKDRNNLTKGVVLVVHSLVEEREKRRIIEESEKRFAAFMRYLPALVLIKDNELRPVYVNEQYKKYFPAEKWMGKTPEETFPSEIAIPMRENDMKAMENGYLSYEEKWTDDKDIERVYETHKFRIERGDKKPYLGAIILDISLKRQVESALVREKKLLESLITTIPDNIYFKDINSKFLTINNSMAKQFGLENPADAIGKSDFDFFEKEHAGQAFRDEQKIISTGIPIVAKEEKETWPDGHFSWVSTTKVPMRDETGKIIGVMGISRDITTSKIAENALRISEERYKLVSELTSDYIYKIDVSESGKLSLNFVSDSFKTITGRELSQVNTMESWNSIIYSEDLQLMNDFIHKLITTRKGGELEIRTYIKDNQQRWVNILAEPILNKDRNTVQSIIGSIKDITQRKLAEEALQETEEIFRNFMEYSPVYVFFKDENIRAIKLSRNFEKMLGKPLEEILGKTMDELFPSELAKNMVEDDRRILEAGEFVVVDEELNGRYYTTIKYPIQIDKNKRYLAGFTIDITDKKIAEESLVEQNLAIEKQNEEYASLNKIYQLVNEELSKSNDELITARNKAEESDRLKSAFLANMSHEIRTPMNAIIGFSDLVIDSNLPKEKLRQYTHTIKQRSYDLLTLINDILDISKIEAGQLILIEESGNVEDLITDVFNTYKMLWCESGKSAVSFNYIYGLSSDESKMMADFGRIRQILLNLVGNAFKFTRQGTITLGCQRKDHDFILFYVSDTGIGIKPEKQVVVFDRFRQAEELHSQLFGGTGLGLSISKGLTELMGGSIWLESEEGKGSTFYFTVPYKPNAQITKKTEEHENTKNDWKNKKILLVEDDEYNSEYLVEALRETGIQVVLVGNGYDAIDMVKRDKSFNLVLLDIRLPDIEGFEVAIEMKKDQPDLPIIAQTAYASENHRLKSVEAGCNDYIAKPIQQDDLLSLIARYLPEN